MDHHTPQAALTPGMGRRIGGVVIGAAGLVAAVLAGAPAAAQNIVFPADSGVIDVTGYGAIPDDGLDDTAAIQAAMDAVSLYANGTANPSGAKNAIIYFPNGRYDISDMLVYPGAQKRLILQGQSRDGVELRLADGLGWSAADSKSILRTGSGTADRFRNAVRDMTFNIGSNNPYASGLQFFASNQGTVRHVRIRSEDGSGDAGLDMAWDDAIGPLLVNDLVVEGFDVGVDTRWQTASQTFENITVRNQNAYGFRNQNNQAVFIHGFTSEQQSNTVIAAANLSNTTEAMVLTQATISAAGGASNNPAIHNQRNLFVADASIDGYNRSIFNDITYGRGNPDVTGPYVEEHFAIGDGPSNAGPAAAAFYSPNRSLRLPVKPTPDVPWEQDLGRWAGPQQFGGTPNDSGNDRDALQAAINSGATTIYLPRGDWILNGDLYLYGNAERFLGTEANLKTTDGTGRIIVIDGDADTVVIERLESGLNSQAVEIQQNTARTLVLSSLTNFEYQTAPTATDPGELFIEDYVGKVAFRDQDVWARQLNVETDTEQDAGEPTPPQAARIVNDGGRVWLSGVKTEKDGTVVMTLNGGETELLGTFHAGSGYSQTDPRFVTIDSSFSAALWADQVGGSGGFDIFARETRNGETRTVTFATSSGPRPNLYTAFAFTDAVDQPELWLEAEGNADDSSGFDHHAAASPSVAYGPGAVGDGSFSLNGVDAHVEITTGVLQQVVEARTVSMFIRPDDLVGLQTLYDEGGPAGGLALAINGASLLFRVDDGPNFTQLGCATVPVGEWSHVAFTYEAGVMKLYVDGQPTSCEANGPASVPWHPTDRSAIGARLDGSAFESLSGVGSWFNGLIDDVRIWGAALDADQIAELAAMFDPGPALPGDADGDGDVDGDDFNAWGASFPLASGATLAQGDFDGDGDVDGDDFNLWGGSFPYPAPGAVAAATPLPVPEPTALAGWLTAALALGRRSGRPRRSRR